jgi:hypothetical protein
LYYERGNFSSVASLSKPIIILTADGLDLKVTSILGHPTLGFFCMPSAQRREVSTMNLKKLILVPAIISLGVTLLRLVGELQNWAPMLFDASAGGGGALVGISWLIPVFGIYFAWKLAAGGHGPASAGKVIGLAILAVAAVMGISFGITAIFGQDNLFALVVMELLISAAGLAIVAKAWPDLFKTLVAYAFAARIPVAILMFFAILGSWGTHYDALPPNFPEGIGWFVTWVVIGLIPQLTVWICVTAVIGMLFGGITALFIKPKAGV